MRANEKYRNIITKPDTRISIDKPVIDDFGFSVFIEDCIDGIHSDFNLYVKAKDKIIVTNDTVACILAGLVLKKYKKIQFRFDVGENTIKEIKSLTKAIVKADAIRSDSPRAPRKNWALNLSGGIDSLTLHLLCPDLMLNSVDYTDPTPEEKAERKTFDKLNANSNTVITNASEFLFPHYSIGYYNLGTLLYADTKLIDLFAAGSIISDLAYSRDFYGIALSALPAPQELYDIRLVYPLIGFNKVGVQKLLYKLNPSLYEDAVNNYFITDFGSQKVKFRLLIDKIVSGKKRKIETALQAIEPIEYNQQIHAYWVYFLKKLGKNKIKPYVKNIPNKLITEINDLTLSFFEKYDQSVLEYLPPDFADYFTACLKKAGVKFYTKKDYSERNKVIAILNKYIKGHS